QPRGVAKYAFELAIIGAGYFALAQVGLTLAAIYSGAVPLWLPAGLALAVVLLPGLRIWPAGFARAVCRGMPTHVSRARVSGAVLLSLGVAAGSALEASVGGYLVNAWSQGRKTSDTAAGVAKFAVVALGPSAMIGAIVGAGSLYLAGEVDWGNFIAIGA